MTDMLDNRYHVKGLLGEGAMGRVHLAEDVLTGQDVAIKVVSPGASGEKTLLQLKQEFRLMTRLRHPHCCTVYSYGVLADGAPYFTMEVVSGHGLDELLPLPAPKAREVLAALLLALGYLHQLGFVYRDLKPANVRLRSDGVVKLMDFGLMDLAGRATGAIAGTLPYVSPEMARRGPIDQRSDLYALGALAYELLTGRPPFVRATPIEVLRAHAAEAPVPPSAHAPGLDPAIEAVVMKLLAKEPTERFQSAAEVLQALGHEAPAGIGGNLLASPLVGRGPELEGLEARLDAVAAGRPGEAILLWGPAGVGKTRLVEELRYASEIKPMPFAMGKAYESGNFPYRHFVWVLKSLLPAMRQQIPEALAERAPTLVKLLPELGAPPAPDLEPSQEKARLQSAVTETLLALASKQGFAVVLENWQWADPLSIELLEHLLRNMHEAPILLVVSSRLAHEGATGQLAALPRLEVGPLGPEAVAGMTTAMLGEKDPDPAFLQQVVALTEGNPLYVERLLDHLVKHGTLVRQAGRWQTRIRLTPESLPQDLAGLLVDALANLQREAVALARAAAVVGRVFDLEMLQRVSGLPEDALFDALTELLQRQVLVPGEAQAYGFKQEAYHDHFYAQVEPETRLKQHAEALAVLESRLAGAKPIDAPLELVTALARHALITGLTEKAVVYALAAGLRNARLFANAEAEEFLLAGLRQIGPGDRWAAEKLLYLETLGNVRRVSGHMEGAQSTLESALPIAEAFGDRLAAGRLRTSLAKVYQMRDRLPEALAACEQALADCEATGARSEAARCLLTRS
ncbi:MAG: protein kinase domain-containing protein, partial [Candidatus Sericytochromatia bacterium]